jgi:transposase
LGHIDEADDLVVGAFRYASPSKPIERDSRDLQPRLLDVPDMGTLTAAKLIAEIAVIERFRSEAKLARLAGIAPIPASSGARQHMRLHRGGNRQLNSAFHRIVVTQMRFHPPAKDYIARRIIEGKTKREAIRCLKRHLARTICNTMTPTLDGTPTPVLALT